MFVPVVLVPLNKWSITSAVQIRRVGTLGWQSPMQVSVKASGTKDLGSNPSTFKLSTSESLAFLISTMGTIVMYSLPGDYYIK